MTAVCSRSHQRSRHSHKKNNQISTILSGGKAQVKLLLSQANDSKCRARACRGRRSHHNKKRTSAEPTIEEKLAALPGMAHDLQSEKREVQLEAASELRKLVSIERNPPLQQVIDTGVVPRLLQLLSCEDSHALQFEAAWALTNLVSGTTAHTNHVIEHGAIPKFIALLGSPSDDVKEQVVWALGNIGGDSPSCRDLVLECGGMKPLLELCKSVANGHINNKNQSKLTLRRNLIWTISNLCRGKPQPAFEQVMPALPVVASLIHCDDEEVLVDACWALSYLSDDHSGSNAYIEAVVNTGVCTRLVELLTHTSAAIQTPALRTIGNIVTGSDDQTQAVVDAGALPALHSLLRHGKKGIRKEAVWAISNITAGTPAHIQCVIEHNIIPPLVNMLRNAPFDIRKEAAWAISNATSGGTDNQLRYLVSQGVIAALCNLLDVQVPSVLDVALSGLENLLKLGVKETQRPGAKCKVDEEHNIPINVYSELVEECGGVDKIEALQSHASDDIYRKSIHILETYFIVVDVDENGTIDETSQAMTDLDLGSDDLEQSDTDDYAELSTEASVSGIYRPTAHPGEISEISGGFLEGQHDGSYRFRTVHQCVNGTNTNGVHNGGLNGTNGSDVIVDISNPD